MTWHRHTLSEKLSEERKKFLIWNPASILLKKKKIRKVERRLEKVTFEIAFQQSLREYLLQNDISRDIDLKIKVNLFYQQLESILPALDNYVFDFGIKWPLTTF